MYILYIPSSCHLNIIGISEHLFACLHLGFGEAQFKNENEEAKEMLAFTTITGRSRFWFYANGLEMSSSPMSVTVHELMFLMSLCQEFYNRLLTSSLVRGQFLTRVYTVPVQTGCYICNEGKEELGECISLFKNTQERDGTVWKKNVEKLRSLQLDNKAFAMKELEGSGSQPAGILFRGHVAMSAMVSDCHSGVCVGGYCWHLVGRW